MRPRVRFKTNTCIIIIPRPHYTVLPRWARMYDMEQEIVANWTLKTLNAQQQRLELNAWPFVGGSPYSFKPEARIGDVKGINSAWADSK